MLADSSKFNKFSMVRLLACKVDSAPYSFYLTYHLLTAGESKQMLLQQRQPPPPAFSGEMNSSSEGAQGRASKSSGAAGPPTWPPQMLPPGHPKHDRVHDSIHEPVPHTSSFVFVCTISSFLYYEWNVNLLSNGRKKIQSFCYSLLTFFVIVPWKTIFAMHVLYYSWFYVKYKVNSSCMLINLRTFG